MSVTTTFDQQHIALSNRLHQALYLFVWLTFFLNAIVIKEPAPCDLFMMIFVVIMPLFGMVRILPLHALFLACWAIIIAGGFIAAGTHEFYYVSVKHMVISLYLAVFSVALAAFVSKAPEQNLKVIWNGYVCGAIIAALAGIVGYFNLFPGAFELFTKFQRASGTFKDPNVLGPYLVPAFLYCLHILLTRNFRDGLIATALMGLFLFAILMSFSRGAWMLFAFSSAFYICFFFFTARDNRQRVKTITLCLLSLIAFIGIIAVALQSPKVQALWSERASLNQSYDVGDQGRFVGHKKAAKIISENPIGIGALYFGYFYHHELPHNLYLSMFLSTGWIGGALFLFLTGATLYFGAKIMLRESQWMHYHGIAYCTFVGLAVESYIIDSDHWRLLYILMGLIWGAYGYYQYEDRSLKKQSSALAA